MLTRTPVTPLVAGVLLDAGPVVAELGAALLYALSVVAWFCVARRFGPARRSRPRGAPALPGLRPALP